MPRLSSWSSGRQIATVAPLEALFAEERHRPCRGGGIASAGAVAQLG